MPEPLPQDCSPKAGGLLKSAREHRRAVLALCVLATCALAVSAAGVRWREDVLDLLPSTGAPGIGDYPRLARAFGLADNVYVAVTPSDEARFPEAMAVADALAERLAQAVAAPAGDSAISGAPDAPLFRTLASRFDPAAITGGLDLLRPCVGSLFTEEEARWLAGRLTPQTLAARFDAWRKQMASTPAPGMAGMLARDPIGLDELLLRRVGTLRPDGPDEVQVRNGRLVSGDGRSVLLIARALHPSTDSREARRLVEYVDRSMREALTAAPPGSVDVSWLAGHRFSLENSTRVRRDIARTVTLSLVGIAVLAMVCFRRSRYVPLALAPALFGGVFALGLLRWLRPEISAISIGCGSMLIGIAVDYGIHILYHLDRARAAGGRDTASDVAARLLTRLLLAAATTIAAFLCLLGSRLPGYRDLGLFAALGISGAVAFALGVLPLLAPDASPGESARGSRRPSADAMASLLRRLSLRRGSAALLVVAVVLAAGMGLPRLRFDADYRKLNAVSEQTQGEWDRVAAAFGDALSAVAAAASGADLEESLRNAERMVDVLRSLESEGRVGGIRSPVLLVPSEETQAGNRQRWLRFWSRERLQRLDDALASAARSAGMRPESFEGFTGGLAERTRPVRLEALRGGALADGLSSMIAHPPGETLVLATFRVLNGGDTQASSGASFEAVADRLRAAAPGVLAASGPAFMSRLVDLLHGELLRIGPLAAVVVMLVLLAALRSPRRVAVLIAPVAMSALATFGLMGWLGVSVNLMNALVCVFVFGLVVDYSVFMLGANPRGVVSGDRRRSAGAVMVSALTTLVGLGSLAAASHPGLRAIGITALLGISSGVTAVFLAVPLSSRGRTGGSGWDAPHSGDEGG